MALAELKKSEFVVLENITGLGLVEVAMGDGGGVILTLEQLRALQKLDPDGLKPYLVEKREENSYHVNLNGKDQHRSG